MLKKKAVMRTVASAVCGVDLRDSYVLSYSIERR